MTRLGPILGVAAFVVATAPERPAPSPIVVTGSPFQGGTIKLLGSRPGPADGEWVNQPAGGQAFRWNADAAIWDDPRFNATLPTLYVRGSLWDLDPAKVQQWHSARQWGKPAWVISRLPTTPTYPVGWLSGGQVFLIDGEYRMKLAGPHSAPRSVNLRDGAIETHLPELEVRAMTARFGLQLPSD